MGHLGELLHQRQLSLGLSLSDLQQRTKIREKYIKAIMEADYELVPGEVYLRGFIRSLASELGIDPEEAMQAYLRDKQQVTGVEEEEKGKAAPAAPKKESIQIRSADLPPRTSSVGSKRSERSGRKQNQGPLYLLIGLLVLVAAGAWYWNSYLRNPAGQVTEDPPAVVDETPPPTEEPEEPEVPAAIVSLSNPGERNPVYLVSPGPLTVVLSSEGEPCWIGYSVDGGGDQQYTLDPRSEATRSLTINAERQTTIKVGNSPVLRMVINGQDQGVLGGNYTRTVTVSLNPTP